MNLRTDVQIRANKKHCKETGFISKLEKDIKSRKSAAKAAQEQSTLDGHLRERPVVESKFPHERCCPWQGVDDLWRLVESVGPQDWVPKNGLLGFVQLNHAHTGKRMGEAPYKVMDRLQIVHKVRNLFIWGVFMS